MQEAWKARETMEGPFDETAQGQPTRDEIMQERFQALQVHHDFLFNLFVGLQENYQQFEERYHSVLSHQHMEQRAEQILQDYYQTLQNHHQYVQDYLETLQDYHVVVLDLMQRENTQEKG